MLTVSALANMATAGRTQNFSQPSNSPSPILSQYAHISENNKLLITSTVAFSPRSREELKSAVDACLAISSKGNCENSPYGPIRAWDVSGVTDMHAIFLGAHSFNADISKWDVSNVTSMHGMFYGAYKFNGDLFNWDVSQVTNMWGMFDDANSFNADISSWTVSRVTDMYQMFRRASSFNADISKWDVSRVTHMGCMFERATSFNADISKWDVSRVTNMAYMFFDALKFNADISDWDVSRVTKMSHMFAYAKSFTHTLCGDAWTHSKADKFHMFYACSAAIGISTDMCIPVWIPVLSVAIVVPFIIAAAVILWIIFCYHAKSKLDGQLAMSTLLESEDKGNGEGERESYGGVDGGGEGEGEGEGESDYNSEFNKDVFL